MLLWVHVHPERRELGKERALLFGQEAEAPVRSLGGGGGSIPPQCGAAGGATQIPLTGANSA